MQIKKMKAIVATGYGNFEVLKLKELDRPQVKEDELLISIKASSATRADTMMLTGKPYLGRLILGINKPKNPIPGTGFSGIIVATGSKVTKFDIGQEVFGESTTGFSTNCEYITVSEDGVLFAKPSTLPHRDAAVFCDGHLTSYYFLNEVIRIKPGQRLLINGASGSLGTSAVQLAKNMGAHVTAVCSSANFGLVKSLGADEVVDYTQEDFTNTNKQYDAIYDTVGKSSFKKAKRVLGKEGIYASPVLKLSLLIKMIQTSLIGKQKAMFAAVGLRPEEELKAILNTLISIYKNGQLKTVIDRQYPLEKVAEAHKYIALGHKKGNIAILVAS